MKYGLELATAGGLLAVAALVAVAQLNSGHKARLVKQDQAVSVAAQPAAPAHVAAASATSAKPNGCPPGLDPDGYNSRYYYGGKLVQVSVCIKGGHMYNEGYLYPADFEATCRATPANFRAVGDCSGSQFAAVGLLADGEKIPYPVTRTPKWWGESHKK